MPGIRLYNDLNWSLTFLGISFGWSHCFYELLYPSYWDIIKLVCYCLSTEGLNVVTIAVWKKFNYSIFFNLINCMRSALTGENNLLQKKEGMINTITNIKIITNYYIGRYALLFVNNIMNSTITVSQCPEGLIRTIGRFVMIVIGQFNFPGDRRQLYSPPSMMQAHRYHERIKA